ncbi:hypothetical protein INT45_009392 [Circinella minor]|uniref:PHD-type domain-containing protein n=1 Tax=Circinella minor TaxID=1195481 RepID=A0A8H7VKH6_9FUNG|nr:hypothetical protein INT45_009392 [Circinella minor]
MSTENLEEIDKIRNNIEFASIAQFFHTFQSAFHPWPAAYNPASFLANQTHLASRAAKRSDDDYVFATEDLESMLLKREERYRLQEIMVRMLRLLTRNRFINTDTWQSYFAKEIDKREALDPNPFRPGEEENNEQDQIEKEDTSQKAEDKSERFGDGKQQQPSTSPAPSKPLIDYFTFPLMTKLHLIYLLCEWQLDDAAAFREHLDSEEDAVHWRVEPIGFDAKGSSYWLFDDNRLYKETPKPKRTRPQKKKSRPRPKGSRRSTRRSAQIKEEEEEEEEDIEEWMPWKLVCISKNDWEEFPKKFENSKNTDEQQFYALLSNDVLPKVIPVLQEHEDELKKKELLANRKRSSRIMYKELAALEHEQQAILEEKEDKTRKSSRREEMDRKKEEKQKANIAKEREERLRDRERRLEQREHAHDEAERKKTLTETKGGKKKTGKTHKGKKRGRKPKNKIAEEEEDAWTFDCVCGVSGQNIDDGTPMIACERCETWQHIECLQKAGQVSQDEEILDKSIFFCKICQKKEVQDVDVDGFEDDASRDTEVKRTKVDHSHHPASSVIPPQPEVTHLNGYRPPVPDHPIMTTSTWSPHQSSPSQSQPQPQSQPQLQPHSHPSHPQQIQRNPDQLSPSAFPILKPMLPADYANRNDHHHPVLPPLLPQIAHSVQNIYPQSIRPAPPVPSVKPATVSSQPQSPQIKLHLRPQPQIHAQPESEAQPLRSAPQYTPTQQYSHRQPQSSQQQYTKLPPPPQQHQQQGQEHQSENNNNGYLGTTHHQVESQDH